MVSFELLLALALKRAIKGGDLIQRKRKLIIFPLPRLLTKKEMDSSNSAWRMEALYYHGVKRTKVCSLHFIQKRRLKKLLEWVNNWKIHGSVSSLLSPFSYQGKVDVLEDEWIRRRDLPIFRRSQGHNDRQQGRMFSQSSRSCVQEFEQCHKRSNFWKIAVSLSRNHSTSC